MKKLAIFSVLTLTFLFLFATNKQSSRANKGPNTPTTQSTNSQFLDTPRMKQYWLVQLLRGGNRGMDKATAQRIQAAHLANIDRLWKEGVVLMAGPMGYKYDNEWRGIFIMDAPDSATAASYIKSDSAVITGRLRFALHPWWTETGTYTFK